MQATTLTAPRKSGAFARGAIIIGMLGALPIAALWALLDPYGAPGDMEAFATLAQIIAGATLAVIAAWGVFCWVIYGLIAVAKKS